MNNISIQDGKADSSIIMEAASKWSQDTINNEIKNGTKFLIKSLQFSIRFQRSKDNLNHKKPSDILSKDENGVETNESGQKELASIMENSERIFEYPKPTSLIKFLCSLIDKRNATVLDFFAGSGTTANAVLSLNAEDGGSRECIIVTNNEGGEEDSSQGIAQSVCYQRIKKVIEGYEKQTGEKERVEGLGGSLEYWKTGEQHAGIATEDDWLELAETTDIIALKEEIPFAEESEDESEDILLIGNKERNITISDGDETDYKLSLFDKSERCFPGEMIAAYQAAVEIVEEIYLDPLERYFPDLNEDTTTEHELESPDTASEENHVYDQIDSLTVQEDSSKEVSQ